MIYRHQMLKQADVVLATFLLRNEFSADQKRRNFDYYEPLATGDSSLSPSVHSIVAAEIGEDELAMSFFRLSMLMDLADVSENAVDGLHVAAAGGTWMALVHGFGGLRDFDGGITFDPRLPETWSRLAFGSTIREQRLDVELTRASLTLTLRGGQPMTVHVQGKPVELMTSEPVAVELVDAQWSSASATT